MLVIERSELKQLSRLFRSSSFLSSGQSGSVSEMQEPLHLLTDDHFYSRHLRAQRGIHSELSAQGVELCCSYFHLTSFLHDEASATSHLASCWQGRPWHHQRWGISWHPFSSSEISSCLFSSGLSAFSPISNSSPSLRLSRIYYLCNVLLSWLSRQNLLVQSHLYFQQHFEWRLFLQTSLLSTQLYFILTQSLVSLSLAWFIVSSHLCSSFILHFLSPVYFLSSPTNSIFF